MRILPRLRRKAGKTPLRCCCGRPVKTAILRAVMAGIGRLGKAKLRRFHGGELAAALAVYAGLLSGIAQAENEVGWHKWLESILDAMHVAAEDARDHQLRQLRKPKR